MKSMLKVHRASTGEAVHVAVEDVRRVTEENGAATLHYFRYMPPRGGTGEFCRVDDVMPACETALELRQDLAALRGQGLLAVHQSGEEMFFNLGDVAGVLVDELGHATIRTVRGEEVPVRDSFARLTGLIDTCPAARFRYLAKPRFHDRRRRRPVGAVR